MNRFKVKTKRITKDEYKSHIPYCESPAVGIGAPECSEDCYKFGGCNKGAYFRYISDEEPHTEFSEVFDINVNGKTYSIDEITKILKKHEAEEEAKYIRCGRCGAKYLENKKYDLIKTNLEDRPEVTESCAWGYSIKPIVTGFQITSSCGNGRKFKLCDNCIDELLNWLNPKEK